MTNSEKLDLLLDKYTGLESGMQATNDKMQTMSDRMQAMSDKMQAMNNNIDQVKRKVSSIDLTLENETNCNIKIIAEGHLDLSRKLDDALKVENEKEMLMIRVNILENELQKVKEQLVNIA